MSLSDQSLQFFPVSARVSAVRARGLRIKGKDGTNDAYAALQAGRETFRTPVSEKRAEPVWGGDDAAFIFTMPPEAADLQVRVLHRVPLGADKLLGLAVVDVHELRRDSERENPQWFKLLNKAGKADKERGEVLLDVQFLKSSMSVSMIDLSDKSHSRLGKFKDKLRGKKKDGLSDSASAILPSVTQVLTDSEGEMDGDKDTTKKKKNKLKSLFVPKSNMKRNSLSQSMSALGTLPDKNSSISSSTSSGLNVESSEGKKKKKFTFLTHKRTGSTDSKASNQSDVTNGSTNQNPASQIDICINGSHIYKEETQSEEVQEMDEEEEEEEEEEKMRKKGRNGEEREKSRRLLRKRRNKQRTQMMEEEERESEKGQDGEKVSRRERSQEEEKRRIEKENETRLKEEERVREEKERKRAEMELKRKDEEKERRNMEMEEKKKKEKQMREDVLFEERVTMQSTDFTRSARISNVKPSVSVPATVSQPSMVNRNPFLDDDLDSSILENVLSVETTAKKGPAPLPPHEKPQLTGPDGSHLKDISKRPAPQPPGMLKMTGKLIDQPGPGQEAKKNPEKHYESKVTSVSEDDTQADTNPFTCDESVAVKPGQIPTPKPRMKTGTVHLGETETNSNGNPSILRTANDITAEDVKSNLSDNLSERKEHLEDKVEPAKPNDLSYVNQDVYPEPQISNLAGLLNSESSQKKSRAPLPPSKPKRTGDLSRPQTMPCLPNKTNLEQSHESRGNQKEKDNARFSSEIRSINTSSATGPSLTFSPLTEKSQVMKPCAANSVDMGSGSQSRTLPWAKVVPNDAGEVKEQVVLTSVIRQHAVKPLSAAETQPEMYESRVSDKTQPNTKVAEAVKGPYSQLTQAELISLVLRQQEQLSQRDARIQELEQYIDNLLVHVMEEKPSILMSMNAMKKSV
ncbi:rab11 family-interacting protein 1-like [Silurus meridionalis]|nr:rab11 family-interacting protein 1-like [Silurus meridionalis]